jgi:RES domain-containing protein
MKVWRISKRRHAATAFSGEGARIAAGRWNPAGVPMVYTSSSLSLALVEVFVHLDAHEAPDFVSIAADLPVDEESLENGKQSLRSLLPAAWRQIGHPLLRQLGADWIASGRSLAMFVPSAVVDGEWNILINPVHPDAARIRLSQPKPFHFDTRMFKGGNPQ